ncbi:hypothetical protein ACIODW_26175 [Streptomyces sp. NPDC087897]|uniref:hypothetical protein n=1 Tax=Streptomyces sp. NPDC087897 TaxID=3365817 RepID=UPI0037FAE6FC
MRPGSDPAPVPGPGAQLTVLTSVGTVKVGGEETRLIILRGTSASGKPSVAAAVRAAFGGGPAAVGQDIIRRTVPRGRDQVGRRRDRRTRLWEWCRLREVLPGGAETVIGPDSSPDRTADRVMRGTGLAGLPPIDR